MHAVGFCFKKVWPTWNDCCPPLLHIHWPPQDCLALALQDIPILDIAGHDSADQDPPNKQTKPTPAYISTCDNAAMLFTVCVGSAQSVSMCAMGLGVCWASQDQHDGQAEHPQTSDAEDTHACEWLQGHMFVLWFLVVVVGAYVCVMVVVLVSGIFLLARTTYQ